MFHRPLAAGALLAVTLSAAWTVAVAQSADGGSRFPPARRDAPRSQVGPLRLEGYWTNDTYTPLERPAELGDKEFFTPEEAVAFVRRQTERLLAQPKDDIHYDDAIWQAENYGKKESLRTSIIVEPRNGRLPPLTPQAQNRLPHQRATQRAMSADSAQSRSLAERCISWGHVGPPMMPPTYYANLQILQTADQVIIRHELMDAVRVIHLDGRPHPGPNVRWLAGHSVGRWEGQTLVVDTANFTEMTNFRGSPQHTRQDIFGTERMRVTERFTLVDANTIRYQFTVNDPDTWTMSWSGEMVIRRIEDPIYEYGCHEGNYGLANILRGARVVEGSVSTR